MKKLLLPFVFMTLIVLLSSCGSTKNMVYFQNIDSISLAASKGVHEMRIMPKDQLRIYVTTIDKEASEPFNIGGTNSMATNGQNSLSYLVDGNGDINFPVIGKIHVAGLTIDECQTLIEDKVSAYLADVEKPVVIVALQSFRVTVAGEVGGSTVINVPNGKMTIMEVLAQAGDVTLQGIRNHVLLIREDEKGEKTAHRLDLTDANLINSEFYYVQQNDYIYVEPSNIKKASAGIGTSATFYYSLFGIVISLTTLAISISK